MACLIQRNGVYYVINDPNDWAKEHTEALYILDLLKRVVRVSVETMKIVAKLAALNEIVDRGHQW